MGLVEVLEQKYQKVASKLDKAEQTASQCIFKCDIATKEKQQLQALYDQIKSQFDNQTYKYQNMEIEVQQMRAQNQFQQGEFQRILESFNIAKKENDGLKK